MFKAALLSMLCTGWLTAAAQADERSSRKADTITINGVTIASTGDGRVRLAAVDEEVELEPAGARPHWIGVRVVPVPSALASHLDLDDAGLMVVNVIKDSPADAVGIQRYDVLVRFGDRPVPPMDRAFAQMVRETSPDKSVKLELIRDGKKTVVEIKPVLRPDREIEYKHDLDPDMMAEDDVRFGGKMLFRGPEGRWRLRDLGELHDLPGPLHDFMPRRLEGKFWWRHDDDEKEIKISIVEGGRRTEIERRADGTYEVRRSREDGGDEDKEVRVYENEQQLREKDPKAYDLLREARTEPPDREFSSRRFGLNFGRPGHGQWHVDIEGLGPEIHEHLREAQRKAQEAIDRALRAVPKEHRNTLERHAWRRWLDEPDEHRRADRDRARFTVDADGKIEVRVEGEDGELTMTFKDADDLKKRKPKLHERYEALQSELDE